MAEGRSNAAIADELVVTERAIEKHVTSIFGKLDLPPAGDTHRRVLAVLRHLAAEYHVFILSRIREAVGAGMATERAVAHGIRATAGVVTSAAAVMVAVFSVFATLTAIEFKQIGLGLAVAVLIDATVVRAVLLPGAMALLGERTWYLPGLLGWLPRLGEAKDRGERAAGAPLAGAGAAGA